MTHAIAEVVHIGPDQGHPGGIEAVIRAYCRMPVDGTAVTALPTWNPQARAWKQIRACASAIISLTRTRKRRGRDCVVHLHLSHRGSFVREGCVGAWARLIGFAVVATIHGSDFVDSASRSKSWAIVYSIGLAPVHRVIVLNEETHVTVRRLQFARPCVILNNPGPLASDYAPRAPHGDPHVFFAGNVGRRKGVDLLIDAWPDVVRTFPDALLRVAGPLEHEDYGTLLGKRYLGTLSPHEITRQLEWASIAVLPSRAEGMPMFLIEALGTSCALAVSRVGAMPMLAHDCGVVFARDDSSSLAAALHSLLSSRKELIRLGKRARERYTHEFDASALQPHLTQVYTDALLDRQMGESH